VEKNPPNQKGLREIEGSRTEVLLFFAVSQGNFYRNENCLFPFLVGEKGLQSVFFKMILEEVKLGYKNPQVC
jgi:hypothetical protein